MPSLALTCQWTIEDPALATSAESLERRYHAIYDERMQGMPIINPRLQVECTGFREFDDGEVGILVTPWFMNLVFLQSDAPWSSEPQGTFHTLTFPSGPIEFTLCHDDEIDSFLSAVLFSDMGDFPDQQMALEISAQVMHDLFEASADRQTMSRRDLFTQLRSS